MSKNYYSWNPSTCICQNSRCLKSNVVNLVIIVFDEYVNVKDSVSTNVTNIISTNDTSTDSMNSDNKKVRHKIHCFILHTFLLFTI